jgi:hypothetical protein
MEPEGRPVHLARSVDRPNGIEDRERGEQPGYDAQQNRRPRADEGDEAQRQQWTADRAEVVHRPLEAVGAAVRSRRHHVGE